MPLNSQGLQSKLWQAADILRGQIDSADYKSYIFSMLFLKRLSDRFDEEVANAVTAGVSRAADRRVRSRRAPVRGARNRPLEPDRQGGHEPRRGPERSQPRD